MKVSFVIPDYVKKTAQLLIDAGYQAHLVGGALRDVVLGIEPDDYDLATDATPEVMMKIFPKSVSTGARFGMVSALVTDEKGETFEVEVTTFRSEADYVDGRWPSKVEFVTELEKDLGRRDFTFNAMALDLKQTGPEYDVYDPFGGEKDLELKIVRAVGTPLERFKEDGLRAFKACRIASQLEFEIEDETFEAIKQALPVAKQVSMERVRDEFMKLLKNSSKPSGGIELMRGAGLLEIFLPELLEGIGVEQKINHSHDVYTHSLMTLDAANDDIKLAALLHDIAKPRCDTKDGHFYGHDVMGAEMTKEIMRRMKFPNAEIERVSTLVRYHMFYFPHIEEGMEEQKQENIKAHEWTDSAVRRFIAKVGDENLDELFELRVADATGNTSSSFKPDEIAELQARIAEVRAEDMALSIEDLDITGHDLMELGVEKGPRVGEILNKLLDMVIDDPLINTKERLIDEAKKLM
jgi:poly(A) polymerase/tRNA nucleotidyltransferase (CCA-adding enzyme)